MINLTNTSRGPHAENPWRNDTTSIYAPSSEHNFSNLTNAGRSVPPGQLPGLTDRLASDDRTRYAMRLVVPPPSQIQVGMPFSPKSTVEAMSDDDSNSNSELDFSRLVAVATLDTAEGQTAGSNALSGRRLADSVHALPESRSDSAGRPVGVVSFPSINIQSAGTYRLRITLIRIDSGNPDGGAAANIREIHSDVIRVSP
jgi:hypothetical protein